MPNLHSGCLVEGTIRLSPSGGIFFFSNPFELSDVYLCSLMLRVELRYAGSQNITCDSLPSVFTFEPVVQREVLIGREGETEAHIIKHNPESLSTSEKF